MDNPRMIQKLNELLKWEYAGIIQYLQFSFIVDGLWSEVFSDYFFGAGEGSLGNVRKIGEKIVALGGLPDVSPMAVERSCDFSGMFDKLLKIEETHYRLCTDAIALCGKGDDGTRILIENICLDQQNSIDDLKKIMKKKGSPSIPQSKNSPPIKRIMVPKEKP